ncbi:hypothetical protein HDU96_001993 [Phlyctochytrium bullatum]|nr:hypothetical protein HDU96_001993 [Phlyctochytrium bullatum]
MHSVTPLVALTFGLLARAQPDLKLASSAPVPICNATTPTLFCPQECGPLLAFCAPWKEYQLLPIADPNVVCSSTATNFYEPFHVCELKRARKEERPPVAVQRCASPGQVVCPKGECGAEMAVCSGVGVGYVLTVPVEGYVCSEHGGPLAFLKLRHQCEEDEEAKLPETIRHARSSTRSAWGTPPAHSSHRPTGTPVGWKLPATIAAHTRTWSRNATPTPTPTPPALTIVTKTKKPATTVTTAAASATSADGAATSPAASAATDAAASRGSQNAAVSTAAKSSAAKTGSASVFANACAAGLAAVFLQLVL